MQGCLRLPFLSLLTIYLNGPEAKRNPVVTLEMILFFSISDAGKDQLGSGQLARPSRTINRRKNKVLRTNVSNDNKGGTRIGSARSAFHQL
ncbi:hypothetical protein DPMN_168754 [Dreissena polymorpha]|uniref:Secreted protein n=1 Tax=Dreissena polymorpha TaxID=45954 RepID=A0A9D4IZX6_DREPO|nr:hypothetical protein DPMN_168754 [Dreissena polymorpha]